MRTAICAGAQRRTGGSSRGRDHAAGTAGNVYSEAQHFSLLKSAVEQETAALTTESRSCRLAVETLESEKAATATELSEAQVPDRRPGSRQGHRRGCCRTARTELADFKAEILARRSIEDKKSSARTGSRPPTSTWATTTSRRAITRWAEMSDEAFDALVSEMTEFAKPRPSRDGATENHLHRGLAKPPPSPVAKPRPPARAVHLSLPPGRAPGQPRLRGRATTWHPTTASTSVSGARRERPRPVRRSLQAPRSTGSALLIGTAVQIDPANPGYLKVCAAAAPIVPGVAGLLVQEEVPLGLHLRPGRHLYDSYNLGVAKKNQLSVITTGAGTKVWFKNTTGATRADGRVTPTGDDLRPTGVGRGRLARLGRHQVGQGH
jgi:hypothetical protein